MPQTAATTVRRLTALLIPADDARPVQVVQVEDRACAYSELIGGGLLEETAVRLPDGHVAVLYLDENRSGNGMAHNRRAARLAEHLHLHHLPPAELRGDVLVTGMVGTHADTDVPAAVLSAAGTCGLLDPR